MKKIILAGAGCGKTTYIINQAKRGDFYLTFNKLAKENAIKKGCLATVNNFHGLGATLISEKQIDWVKRYEFNIKTTETLHYAQLEALNEFANEVECETLFVDEVQDLNEQMVEIVQKINWKNLVLVGDDCQNIMGWNGVEKTDWKAIYPDIIEESLATTYRFGKDIADFSNLFRLDKKEIEGNVAVNSKIWIAAPTLIGQNQETGKYDKVFDGALKLLSNLKGTKAVLVRKNKEKDLIYSLLKGLGMFPTSKWNNKKAEKEIDPEKVVFVDTVYKAKGLEWDNVFLDLPDPYFFVKKSFGKSVIFPRKFSVETINLFYVGLTRAKRNLILEKTAVVKEETRAKIGGSLWD